MNWFHWSLLSALFAGLTAILAKLGTKDVDANLATAFRTLIVLIIASSVALWTNVQPIRAIPSVTWGRPTFSGLASCASWLCYFHALKVGEASKVAPVDKLSVVVAMVLAACPDDSIRDGDKAARYAQKACELTDWKHPAVLNTLAIAYAELGDWQAATDICDQELGKSADGPLADEFRLLFELFKQEKPYRLRAHSVE